MEKRTNYGKIIAITLAVISAASAIAYVIYRLARNFFTFCDSYQEEEIDSADFDFDGLYDEDDELIEDEEPTEAEEQPAVEE